MKGVIPSCLPFPEFSPKTKAAVLNTCKKIQDHFREYDNILISVSGGSDSTCIVHLICKYFPEYIKKCHFVFIDTGIEYKATKEHICYLQNRYNINIKTIHGKSVVWAVKKYGIPILNKEKSQTIHYYMLGKQWAVERVQNRYGRLSFSENEKNMIRFCMQNDISIFERCCYHAKKSPIAKYMKDNECGINVTGERKCEGGMRSFSHKTCFEVHKNGDIKFMPLWYWDNETKSEFKEKENIVYSDCYEKYGMKRTGCVGCPFNVEIWRDLEIMKQYEPDLYNLCINVFGVSYALCDKFNLRKQKILKNDIDKILNL